MSSPALTVAKFCLPAEELRILEQIDLLRAQLDAPMPWKDVARELSLFGRRGKGYEPLRPYVWLLAALLRCQNFTWPQVAAHPWVDGMMNETTLRTNASRAKLPGNLAFNEFIEEWRLARESESRKLAQAQAAEDARRSRNVFEDSLNLAHSHIRAVLYHEKAQGRLELVDQDGDPMPLSEEELDEILVAAKINKDATATAHSAYQGLRLINNQATEIHGDDDGKPGAEFSGDSFAARQAELDNMEAALDAELAALNGEVA